MSLFIFLRRTAPVLLRSASQITSLNLRGLTRNLGHLAGAAPASLLQHAKLAHGTKPTGAMLVVEGAFMTISTLILMAFFTSAQFVSIDARDMDLGDFLRFMANIANMNVVLHPSVQGRVNLMVNEARWEQVLDVVLKTHGLAKEVEGNVLRIAPVATLEAEQRGKAATAEACLKAL